MNALYKKTRAGSTSERLPAHHYHRRSDIYRLFIIDSIIDLLSNKHPLKLYTPEATPQFPSVKNCGPVDYCNEMPLVFKNSKINLNISLKSIYSGIPLRSFDIMGCGGFLLTDFQMDYNGLFIPDEDYVFYTTTEDLISKVDYYLENEDKRIQIASNGYAKVKEKHTYDIRVKEILKFL